jgi:anti-sigma factor RsiW
MSDLAEMPCRELVEVVTAYLEDALPERDRRRFEAHLEECDDCREYLEQFRETIALAGRVAPDGLSPQARADLLAAFRDLRM